MKIHRPIRLVLALLALGLGFRHCASDSRPSSASSWPDFAADSGHLPAWGFAPSQPSWGAGAGSPADAWLGGSFHGNSNLGTAISTSGSSGYIALGGGDFVSW